MRTLKKRAPRCTKQWQFDLDLSNITVAKLAMSFLKSLFQTGNPDPPKKTFLIDSLFIALYMPIKHFKLKLKNSSLPLNPSSFNPSKIFKQCNFSSFNYVFLMELFNTGPHLEIVFCPQSIQAIYNQSINSIN